MDQNTRSQQENKPKNNKEKIPWLRPLEAVSFQCQGGTIPAIGSSATTTGIAKAGGTGSSAIEEKAGAS